MTRKRVSDEHYGQLSRRMQELSRRVDEGTVRFDGAMTGLQQLIETEDLEAPEEIAERTWRTPVDYATPIDALLEKFGRQRRIDLIDTYFTSKYIPTQHGVVSATLDLKFVRFKKAVPLMEASDRLGRYGWRSLTAHELVAFTTVHPDLICFYPLVALATKIKYPSGAIFAPCVDQSGNTLKFAVICIGDHIALSNYLAVHI